MDLGNTHIKLTPMGLADVDQVLLWENTPEFWSVSENDSPYSRGDIEQLVHDLEDIQSAKQARYIIWKNEQRAGIIDLYSIDFHQKEAYIGILIDSGFQRKGIASNAIQLIEHEALNLNLDFLNAWVQTTNNGSIDLFKKLNYLQKGISEGRSDSNPAYLDLYFFQKCLRK